MSAFLRWCADCWASFLGDPLRSSAAMKQSNRTLGTEIPCPEPACTGMVNLHDVAKSCKSMKGVLAAFQRAANNDQHETEKTQLQFAQLQERALTLKAVAGGDAADSATAAIADVKRALRLVSCAVCPQCDKQADMDKNSLHTNCMAMSCDNAACSLVKTRSRYCHFCRQVFGPAVSPSRSKPALTRMIIICLPPPPDPDSLPPAASLSAARRLQHSI